MITRSQAATNQGGNRCALQDVSNHMTAPAKQNKGDVVAKVGNHVGQNARYNLRPRKIVTKSIEITNDQKSRKNEKNKQQKRHTGVNSAHHASADDIDEGDEDDPQFATAYVNDVYTHLRNVESSTSVRPLYMKDQTHINEHTRQTLVNWLVEVHQKFRLVPGKHSSCQVAALSLFTSRNYNSNLPFIAYSFVQRHYI